MSKTQHKITGQVVYVGPHLQHLGLSYGTIFRDGIYPHFYNAISACPALGGLFVPIKSLAVARRELNFDFGHKMRGTTGRYVTFYREVQKWLRESVKQSAKPSPSGVTIEEETHA
jgi:hypothetical protein